MRRLIDADAMIKRLEEWNTSDSGDKALYNFTMNRILEQPTIEPEQKTGKWKGYNADNQNWLRTDGSPVFLICSECGQVVVNNFSSHWNYYSNCGCKMEVEE